MAILCHTFQSKGVPYVIMGGAFFPMLIRAHESREDGMTYFNPLQRS